MTWSWPLDTSNMELPDIPGRFGAIRKYDIHTGIDLYTSPGMAVLAVEDGVVVAIEKFTGPDAGSPWWNDTEAILVEGASGVVCYGEITVRSEMVIGTPVKRKSCLGHVKTVLRNDKGRPQTMLHIELYKHGTRESGWWYLGDSQPLNLLDPTNHIEQALEEGKVLIQC